ncbi:MAG TPA: SpoIID/LytB domain-containing protein, partial [Myxococcaceae bacterium]|nr:SpoIID/LytB domain-containing protein [Myxococcaceae bacterium]
VARVQLGEFAFADKDGLARAQAAWSARGVATRVHTLGSRYGIAGKVLDNRTHLLLLDGTFSPQDAQSRQAEILQRFGASSTIVEELRAPPSAGVQLIDEEGNVVAVGRDRIDVEALEGEAIEVRQVEFGIGYEFHGFEDRRYRGVIRFVVDRSGMLAVVNVVRLEDLLQGLVPSEIFARAHVEALKAQAVTARGEVLAKVGTRHLADPYLLCAEQHCAVYRGLSGEAAATNAAVEATRGEALFSREGRLVDSVYSALCGGYTENNENVWGGVPNPHLRGRPDLIRPSGHAPTPKDLSRFLDADLPVACRLSTLAAPGKYRWERRFTAAEVDALFADLGVGRVRALSVLERGVSGRATSMQVSGEKAAVELRGELGIRRRFRMLNSSMFEIVPEPDEQGQVVAWKFRGGGWGHGVGLCQTGAIGRAEAGQSYREILRHYFSGARVMRLY